MDGEDFTFVGAKVEISFTREDIEIGNIDYLTYEGSLEIAKSTNKVKTLTDAEKLEYTTSFGE